MIALSPLFAVHISDGILSWPWLVGGAALVAAMLAVALPRIHPEIVSRLGVMTAVFFAGSQIHVPVGPVSVHLLLNGPVGIVLGFRAVIPIVCGLVLQAVLLYHGGLTTLGINAAVMALPALLARRAFLLLPTSRIYLRGFAVGLGVASVTIFLNAAVLYFGAEGDWALVAKTVLILHLPVALIEGFNTAFAVAVIARSRPEWLTPVPCVNRPERSHRTESPTDPSPR